MSEENSTPVIHGPLTRRKPCGYASETAGLLSAARNQSVVILCLLIALAGSLYVNLQDRKAWRNQQTKFVGIKPDGSLVTLDARMFDFPVTDATLRAALLDFVHKHFERVQTHVKEDYAASLQFLYDPIKIARQRADIVNIKAVLEGQAEEVRVDPLSVTLRNIRSGCEKGPCEASVIIKKTYQREAAIRTVESTVELEFVVRPKEVTDRQVMADNPMGLVITDLHEYAYFEPDALGKAALVSEQQP